MFQLYKTNNCQKISQKDFPRCKNNSKLRLKTIWKPLIKIKQHSKWYNCSYNNWPPDERLASGAADKTATVFVQAAWRDAPWENAIICNRTRNLGRSCPLLPRCWELRRGPCGELHRYIVHPLAYFDRDQQYYLIMHFSRSQKSKLLLWAEPNKDSLRTPRGLFTKIITAKNSNCPHLHGEFKVSRRALRKRLIWEGTLDILKFRL